MAEGFGQWREVDLAFGQSWALAWAEEEEKEEGEEEEEEGEWGG